MTHTSSNRGRTFPVEVLTSAEINALITACSKRARTGVRNRALIAVLWRAGLRIGEALALTPKDIDLQRGTLHVLRSKTGKPRMVAIDPQTAAYVQRWLDIRPKAVTAFCTLSANRINPADMRELFARLGKKAGVEKRVHPHAFRHSAAYDMLQEGVRLDIISRQLGHSSLATTARYLAHVANPEVRETIAARVWPDDVCT